MFNARSTNRPPCQEFTPATLLTVADCQHALDLIGNTDSLFIGGGASTQHFARSLRLHRQSLLHQKSLTVLTPALSIATEVATNPKIEVMVLPGLLDAKEGLVHGAETLHSISRYRTPLAIMGASGVDENGISEALLQLLSKYRERST